MSGKTARDDAGDSTEPERLEEEIKLGVRTAPGATYRTLPGRS